ncbi:uncharacterized protein LOC124311402 [Daphnia pulicaria]|uniref:uncharacterized protein LOC124311402 n=1 Tax=Daphnia pulicaria TaxID=35523 RepID=UPI001EEC528D|nr:uncharacterized protein LOC124311402 [Daphnia pulicaria]
MSKFLLSAFSCLDFVTGVISIIVQSVIIANHDDCAYSKMGVGIWNGLLLIMTGISLLVTATRPKGKTGDWTLVVCAMTLMASLVQVGVASGVIYQLYGLQYFEHGPFTKPLNGILDKFKPDNIPDQKQVLTSDFPDSFLGFVNQVGGNLVSNTARYGTVRACYGLFSIDDYYGSQRKTLEVILLGCGLIAIVVKIASFLSLRVKRLAVSASIQYTQQTATH